MGWQPLMTSGRMCAGKVGTVYSSGFMARLAIWGDLTAMFTPPSQGPSRLVGLVYNYGGWADSWWARGSVPSVPAGHPLPDPLVQVDEGPFTIGDTVAQLREYVPGVDQHLDDGDITFSFRPVPGTAGTVVPSDRISEIDELWANC
jgi:hypothetical protein